MKFVHMALMLTLAGVLQIRAEDRIQPITPDSSRVVVRGEATPRPIRTPLGVVREDELDPQTGIPVSYERERMPVNAADEGAPAPALQTNLPLPATMAEAGALQEAVNNLSLAAALQRGDAENYLRSAGDAGLAALVQWGLYHELPSVRTRSAELLGTWGGRRVLKFLIEAFYSAAYPTIPPYQVQYMVALDQKISQLTGQNFSFPVRRGGEAPAVANQIVLWWTGNYAYLPPQLGEALLDARDTQYASYLKQARSLTLEKREFAGASLPPDVAGPPLPNTPAEERYINLIPRIPPNFGIDRNVSTSLTPSVPKNPAPQRDSPGDFRRQQYESKLRTELRPVP